MTSKNDAPHSTAAPQILREADAHIRDLFNDFESQQGSTHASEIRDLAIAEIRLYRALLEDVFLPAVFQGDAAAADTLTGFESLEPLLEGAERPRPEGNEFRAAWGALRTATEKILENVRRDILPPAEKRPVDFVSLGLKMIELRREISAEQPVKPVPTDNDPRC